MFRDIKLCELRAWDEKRQKIRVGDEWSFSHKTEPHKVIVMIVREIMRYPNIRDAIEATPMVQLMGSSISVNEAVSVYEKIGDYQTKIEKYGAVCFKLERVVY